MDKAMSLRLKERIPQCTSSLAHVNVHPEHCQSLVLFVALSVCTVLWSFKFLRITDLPVGTNLAASYKATKEQFRVTLTRENESLKGLAYAAKNGESIELEEKLCYAAAATLFASRETDSITVKLWSNNQQHVKSFEYEEPESCTKRSPSGSNLLRFTLTSGNECTELFMHAFSHIELSSHVDRRDSAITRSTEGIIHSSSNHVYDVERVQCLSENLRANIEYIASQLTPGETTSIIMKLRSHKEQYLKLIDYEDLKELKGATRKGIELIDLVLKNKRAVPAFADALKDVGRTDLCNVVLLGRAR